MVKQAYYNKGELRILKWGLQKKNDHAFHRAFGENLRGDSSHQCGWNGTERKGEIYYAVGTVTKGHDRSDEGEG